MPESIILSTDQSTNDIADLKTLTLEYAEWLARDHGISLEFQNIEQELAGLPGKYALPRGAIIVARSRGGQLSGCIALRPFDDIRGEIKRLYVRPAARGLGVAQLLTNAVVEVAKKAGYRKLVLDTGAMMLPAQKLYEQAGFDDIAPYYHNPYNARFMGCDI